MDPPIAMTDGDKPLPRGWNQYFWPLDLPSVKQKGPGPRYFYYNWIHNKVSWGRPGTDKLAWNPPKFAGWDGKCWNRCRRHVGKPYFVTLDSFLNYIPQVKVNTYAGPNQSMPTPNVKK